MHHDLMLLALHDQKGTIAYGKMQHFGLAGAVFAELLLLGRLRIVTERRRRKDRPLVEVVDPSRTGETVLDAALGVLAGAKRRAAPQRAVEKIARVKDLRHEVARELVRRGVVRATEDQVLLLFTRRVYPTLDPGPERALVARIRDALDGPPPSAGGPPAPVDLPTAIVIALADATGILRALYGRRELKALKPRIQTLVEEAGAGADVAREAVQAAINAAVAATSAAVAAATAG